MEGSMISRAVVENIVKKVVERLAITKSMTIDSSIHIEAFGEGGKFRQTVKTTIWKVDDDLELREAVAYTDERNVIQFKVIYNGLELFSSSPRDDEYWIDLGEPIKKALFDCTYRLEDKAVEDFLKT